MHRAVQRPGRDPCPVIRRPEPRTSSPSLPRRLRPLDAWARDAVVRALEVIGERGHA